MLKENSKVSIHQPDFFPYFGFFNKINKSDIFVVMDKVQISKSGWTHRDQIKTKKGVEWITVPINKIKEKQLIKDAEINENIDWRKKHLNLIYANYKDAEYFEEGYDLISNIYKNKSNSLFEFNLSTIKLLFEKLDIKPKIVLLSELEVFGTKNDLLISILNKINIKHYVSGLGAKNFIDIDQFEKRGFVVTFNKFEHPKYNQLFGAFICNLSIIDIILNIGINKTKQFIHNA